MRFSVNDKIFEKFPGLNIGVLKCEETDNTGISEQILSLIGEKEKEIGTVSDLEVLSENPKISVWRQAYKAFGVNSKDNFSSVESLYRAVLQGRKLRHINKIVDIYNYMSLKHIVPAGGEDLNMVKGDIQLTFAGADEPSVLLLGDKDPRSPHPGEIIYKDEISAICRRFNWREADRTKLTENTKKAVLVIESLPPVAENELKEILKETKSLIEKDCGGKIDQFILSKDNPEIEIY